VPRRHSCRRLAVDELHLYTHNSACPIHQCYRKALNNFFGNQSAVDALTGMIRREQITQTLLLSGPEGVGKATLARRFAAQLLGHDAAQIEQDDLSLPANLERIADREKWPADKRNDDPLVFNSHPDFLTFAPDGPLRQITIQQMRLLKDRVPLRPVRGGWRVFLIDSIDRANEQAANSLLKTLEEPPSHLILILTARNPYDLLPTIRSRAVPLRLGRLTEAEMRAFVAARKLDHSERRSKLAEGSPGLAISIDLEVYDRRRTAMLALLRTSAGLDPFGAWLKHSDSIAARRSEKLESYIDVLYALLEDVVRLANGMASIRNDDIRQELEAVARRVSFEWLRVAVARAGELLELARRNIQKQLAFDAFAVALRSG
jgi:DNA polymerase-3 subunit delta'